MKFFHRKAKKYDFSKLADDINLHIFSFLNLPQLGTIAKVNKQFNQLAKDEKLISAAKPSPIDYRKFNFAKTQYCRQFKAINAIVEFPHYLFAYCNQNKIYLIDGKKNYQQVGELTGHEQGVTQLVKVNNNFLISFALDYKIKLWNIPKRESIRTINCTGLGNLTAIAMLNETDLIVAVSKSNGRSCLYIWNVRTGELLNEAIPIDGKINFIAAMQEQKTFVVSYNPFINIGQLGQPNWAPSDMLKIFSLADYTCIRRINLQQSHQQNMIKFNEQSIACVTAYNTLCIWDIGKTQKIYEKHYWFFQNETIKHLSKLDEKRIALLLNGSLEIIDIQMHLCVNKTTTKYLNLNNYNRLLKLADGSIAVYSDRHSLGLYIVKFPPLKLNKKHVRPSCRIS